MARTNLRDVTRTAVRDEIARRAWALFAGRGFEATTVDEIAEDSGMSRRTFFRYFQAKEELVLVRLLESVDEVAARLQERPRSEPAWPALLAATRTLLEAQQANGEVTARLLAMLKEPGLRSVLRERDFRWRRDIGLLLDRRFQHAAPGVVPGPGTEVSGNADRQAADPRGAAVAGATLACLEAAQDVWLNDPSGDLVSLFDLAVSAVVSPELRNAKTTGTQE